MTIISEKKINGKDVKIINESGYYFPLCKQMVEEAMTEAGFYTTKVVVSLDGDTFRVMVCGDENTGMLAYCVKQEDYRKVISLLPSIKYAHFGEVYERDRARGCGRYVWDRILASTKSNPRYDWGTTILGEEAQGWCLVLAHEIWAHLITSQGILFSQYNGRWELD